MQTKKTPSKMVAFFTPGLYPCAIGGMEIFYYYLTKEISKDNKLIILTDCRHTKTSENVTVLQLNTRLFLIRRFGLSKLSLIISSFVQIIIHRKKIDLLHVTLASHSGYYGLIFPLIKRMFGIRYMVTFHGGGLLPWSKYSFFRPLFRHADKCVAVSSVIKETLEQRTKKKLELILPLVPYKGSNKSKEELQRKYGINENSKVIVMVGSLQSIKGSYFVVEAFAELGIKYLLDNKLTLVLAGDGPDKTLILNAIERNQISDFIKLIGIIPNENVHEIFVLADFYVIASEFEGTSKSLLEAMYNGLPIIASNVKGINNIIIDEKNGMLFEYSNKAGFISKFKKMIANPIQAADFGQEAKLSFNSNYSFKNTVDAYLALLNNIG
jgi:glycosyltransferase involved in cell wall biosynthesis